MYFQIISYKHLQYIIIDPYLLQMIGRISVDRLETSKFYLVILLTKNIS